MFRVIAHVFQSSHIEWEALPQTTPVDVEGVVISFPQFAIVGPRAAMDGARRALDLSPVSWLTPGSRTWSVDLDKLRLALPDSLGNLDWLRGTVDVKPELERHDFFGKEKTSLELIVTKELAMTELPKKIFLSHKSASKPLVRNFKRTLDAFGFDVWLDEDAMTAGANLDRSILQGFKDSCAAVFFLTPHFKDENFLATEIDYAIAEKRIKGERFSIVTLLLAEDSMPLPDVPELLKRYVWIQPADHLDALREIIRALPLRADLTWR